MKIPGHYLEKLELALKVINAAVLSAKFSLPGAIFIGINGNFKFFLIFRPPLNTKHLRYL